MLATSCTSHLLYQPPAKPLFSALEQEVAVNETISVEDRMMAVRALDSVLSGHGGTSQTAALKDGEFETMMVNLLKVVGSG